MKQSTNRVIVITALAILMSCLGNDGKSGADYIKVEFTGPESLAIKNPHFDLKIFGHDRMMADGAASLIVSEAYEATTIPFTLKINIPNDPVSQIELIDDKKDAKYYIHIEWDSDNNGKVCEGDITLDYEAKFPNVKLNTKNKQKFVLTTIPESTPCD